MIPGLRTYSVNPKARWPLVEFMLSALEGSGCRIVHPPTSPDVAPFVVVFETPTGERIGLVAYAFLATRTPTKNRPPDERSFQIKYGSKAAYAHDNSHELWQDPFGMFTTMLVGIDPERGLCFSADPIIHSPTKFFIRVEFKDEQAETTATRGWFAWERIKLKAAVGAPRVETMVGATKENFLELVLFERAARGLDPGNRLILAENRSIFRRLSGTVQVAESPALLPASIDHPLVTKFKLTAEEILDLIQSARRLEMAVRGGVAEGHLRTALASVPGISHCERLDLEGGPDIAVEYRGGPRITLECKNVARERDKQGNPKIDFQRTRAAKADPCSRYYKASEFDIVAACLHAVSAEWNFRYVQSVILPPHKSCPGRINSNIRVDNQWLADPEEIFRRVYAAKGIYL